MKDVKLIIFYLNFAKSRLDNNNLRHRKAKEEITSIIENLKLEQMEAENEKHIPII